MIKVVDIYYESIGTVKRINMKAKNTDGTEEYTNEK